MPDRRSLLAVAAMAVVVGLCSLSAFAAQDGAAPKSLPSKGKGMSLTAHGEFEVKLTPLESSAGESLGRMSLDKTFHGEFEGTGKGEMLAAMATEGSAGYVAIEKVSGKLNGRAGSFVLQHSGTMTRGKGTVTVSVVPDSGTDQLVGLTGTMAIEIKDGKHYYHFEYALPEAP